MTLWGSVRWTLCSFSPTCEHGTAPDAHEGSHVSHNTRGSCLTHTRAVTCHITHMTAPDAHEGSHVSHNTRDSA